MLAALQRRGKRRAGQGRSSRRTWGTSRPPRQHRTAPASAGTEGEGRRAVVTVQASATALQHLAKCAWIHRINHQLNRLASCNSPRRRRRRTMQLTDRRNQRIRCWQVRARARPAPGTERARVTARPARGTARARATQGRAGLAAGRHGRCRTRSGIGWWCSWRSRHLPRWPRSRGSAKVGGRQGSGRHICDRRSLHLGALQRSQQWQGPSNRPLAHH